MSGKGERPNILFFFTDQQRWDTCGCYGQKLDITPNLDRLAAEGVRFERAFSCQPVCGPARACIQTGKYATEVGCHTNHRLLPPTEATIAKLLRASGYEVGYIGKWHLASTGPHGGPDDFRTKAVPPERRGGYEDYWLVADALEHTSHGWEGGFMFDKDMNKVEFPGYRVDAETDFALDYLRTRDRTKPWFLFLSYLEPHHQNDRNHYEGPAGSKERFKGYEIPGDLVDTEGDWRDNYPDYLGACWSLDHNLGRILDELEKLGMRENTLVVFTSDHGSHFRTRNNEYKRSCHDGSIRIPMVLNGPGFRGGKVIDDLVGLIDISPTVVAAGGAEVPQSMRGRPLQDLADGSAGNWPEEVFVQISESHCGRAIRTKKWKYSVIAPNRTGQDPNSDVYVEDFLYDLECDPHERNNLVKEPSTEAVRSELRERLIARMIEAGENAPLVKPA
ncbi:MAG: sulfatase-like hydrolase/transferase [Chitinivibrionales bacterium]|nr:sulfatase-like hydrolase/transferase [Chitinivibrionales bacterium]MBD3355959.1 sulfatase-like hydrolase/transferase [Chitinivibrionales bacterium]